MGRVAFLTDRSPAEALPAIQSLGLDVKTEPLAPDSLAHLLDLGPSVVVVDAEANPEQGYRLLTTMVARGLAVPLVVLASRMDLERFPWAEVADELVFSGVTASER